VTKPRIYREKARKDYLRTAQKKKKTIGLFEKRYQKHLSFAGRL